jgi:hypothetical protein
MSERYIELISKQRLFRRVEILHKNSVGRVTEAVYGRAGFRYGWKKQNKMHQKKLHFYCVLKVLTDPPMVLCCPYRSLVRSLRRL